MKIVIFGASGHTGRKVVALAMTRGYEVVAFVHTNNPFSEQTGLTVIHGDIHDQSAVAKAVTGCDAVISTLGSWKTIDKTIVSTGIQTILTAMEQTGTVRVISLTGSGAYWSKDELKPIDKLSHLLLKLINPKVLLDGEAHLATLEASSAQWTAIRSPGMRNGHKATYRLDNHIGSPLAAVNRAAVATALLDQLTDTSFIYQAPVIHAK